MFETLSDKLTGSLRKVRGRGRLTEDNVGQTLKEVKMALLEADVNFRVVKAFLRSVKARAVGEEVQGSLTPGQQFIKIVNEELTEMMGGANSGLTEPESAPLIAMLVGLQGAGKTSTVGKLARFCQTEGKRPYLIPADIYRFMRKYYGKIWLYATFFQRLINLYNPIYELVGLLGTRHVKRINLFEKHYVYKDYFNFESELIRLKPLVIIIIPLLFRSLIP